MIIGGEHPYAQDLGTLRQVFRKGNEAMVADWEQEFGPLDPTVKARLLANDAQALYANVAKDWPDVSDVLPTIEMPCLLYVGEADEDYPGMKEAANHISNVAFVSLPGLGHIQATQRSDLVLPHVMEFLKGHQ